MLGTLGTTPLEAPGLFITVTGHRVPYVSGCLLELLVLLPLLPNCWDDRYEPSCLDLVPSLCKMCFKLMPLPSCCPLLLVSTWPS